MDKETILAAIDALDAGKTPVFTTEDVPAFDEEATRGNEHVSPASLDAIMASLTRADIPTLERAVRAIDEGDLAWLGFKVVYDPALAVNNVDNAVTKKYGDVGSADGDPLLFFCNDAKEIVCSRPVSDRDVFQMKDVTRGPSMHNEQFEGLTWASVALFDPVRVWLLGASDVAVELAKQTTIQNGAIGLVFFVPGADMPLIALNQAKMVLQIAAVYGKEMNRDRIGEILAVMAGGFGCRAVARQLVARAPVLGWAIKPAVAASGTMAMAIAAIEYYEEHGRLHGLSEVAAKAAEKAAPIVDKGADLVGTVVSDATARA